MVLGFSTLPLPQFPPDSPPQEHVYSSEYSQQPEVCLLVSKNKNRGGNSYLFLLRSIIIVISRLAEIAQQRNIFWQAGKSREYTNTFTSVLL